ncbi:MAG: hypothetical protein Kow00127_24490 [Bacteroidales bacterium]
MKKLFLFNVVAILMIYATNGRSFTYLSPVPGSKFAQPEHQITIRADIPFDQEITGRSIISVTGSISGNHPGMSILTADRMTWIFKPASPFVYGETVTVHLGPGVMTDKGEVPEFSYTFSVMPADNEPLKKAFLEWEKSQLPEYSGTQVTKTSKGKDLPGDFPEMWVTVNNNPTPGYFFITPHNPFHPLDLPSYSMIIDNYGTPVFYKLNNSHSLDLKRQETGQITHFIISSTGGIGISYGHVEILDDYMRVADTLQMGNGYEAEMHESLIFNDGSKLLFTYDPQIIDMSQIVEGGDPAATVMGCILQELDADNNVVFEWSSWDYIPVTDATPNIDLTKPFIDYCHANAIERDYDGNILVSFRHLDEIIKIDRQTGEIIWRLNAFYPELSDFTFVNDTIKFSHQHDIRRLENGNITLYDNGNLHWGPYSRALEYAIDEENMTVEPVWVYPPEPKAGNIFAFATGSNRLLENGNRLINWGISFVEIPMFTEVDQSGEKRFEIYAADTVSSYRAVKSYWDPANFSLSKDTIDWGEYTGYTPEPYIIVLTNNSEDSLTVTGTYNRTTDFFVNGTFPGSVAPGETYEIVVNFFPQGAAGQSGDVLTIFTEPEENVMVARQVVLLGYRADDTAPEITFDPANGAVDVVRMPDLTINFDEMLYLAGGEELTGADLPGILEFKAGSASGEPVPFTARLTWKDVNKTTFVVTPVDTLQALSDYYLAVKPDMLEDWAGNVVTGDNSIIFTTGEQLGIDEAGKPVPVLAYPSPGNGLFNIAFGHDSDYLLEVYNFNGQRVLTQNHLKGTPCRIDLRNEPSGVYIIRFSGEEQHALELKVLKN